MPFFPLQSDQMKVVVDALLSDGKVMNFCCQDKSFLLPAVYWSRWKFVYRLIVKEKDMMWKKTVLHDIVRMNKLCPDLIYFALRDVFYEVLQMATRQLWYQSSEAIVKFIKK